ncbi:MAG: Transcriptional regulator, AraC family [Burkholderiaceae bacterium]|jgi:AraC-like DNA-binding protein|nr:MAG: Transcriptional regulator, AraC family [Burkholderiaceae bacterium]
MAHEPPDASAHEFIVRQTALAGLTLVTAYTSRRFDRHTHAVYGIGVIDAGGQTSASGRGQVEAVRGEVITVNPGEVHDGVPMQGEKRRWRMVYFDPALWNSEQSTPEWVLPVLRDERVMARFEALFASAARGGDALAVEEHLTALLHHAPSTAAASHRVPSEANGAVRMARERLADDTLAPPSLAEMARDAAMSRYQFLRAFAAAFGLPPHAWAQQQRMARAEACLLSGLTPAEAAVASGFSDQSHMTRAFRRFRGYTPGSYAGALRQSPR